MTLQDVRSDIADLSDPVRAKLCARYFKTGKGEYAEGDVFLGLTVPQVRLLAKKHRHLPLSGIKALLSSKMHEERLCALIILTDQFSSQPEKRKEIFDFYMSNLSGINNWDLVDQSAPRIAGAYLSGKDKSMLETLAKSRNIWERRIAIISTLYFIVKDGEFDYTLKICALLMHDKHDLIHKACGWMLREVGKRDEEVLKGFIRKNYASMPRTMLRYAIERFPEKERKAYLKGEI